MLAVSLCTLAIGAVVTAAVLQELRNDPLLLFLAVVVVVTSWPLTALVLAVDCAHEDARLGGLRFAQAEQQDLPRFSDYCYLAVQVNTAYNSADVTLTGGSARRAVTAHAIVAFVFNTVLIALLVSLLITVST